MLKKNKSNKLKRRKREREREREKERERQSPVKRLLNVNSLQFLSPRGISVITIVIIILRQVNNHLTFRGLGRVDPLEATLIYGGP